VRIVSLHQGWPHGGAANIPSPVEAAVLTLATSSPKSTKQPLPPTGVTGAAQIVTSERRPISLVAP
jgi:hypothetical protein